MIADIIEQGAAPRRVARRRVDFCRLFTVQLALSPSPKSNSNSVVVSDQAFRNHKSLRV